MTVSEIVIDLFYNAIVAPSITGTENNTQLNNDDTTGMRNYILWLTYCHSVQICRTKLEGADELVPRLLILIKDEISYPLTVLFKKSLAEGVVPEDWRRANVSPIYKKGKKYCREL